MGCQSFCFGNNPQMQTIRKKITLCINMKQIEQYDLAYEKIPIKKI